MFTLAFDQSSMKLMADFGQLPGMLESEMQPIALKLGALIAEKTQENGLARFAQNSPGGLAESFETVPVGTQAAMVGTAKPYGWRLQAGFDGADSLGRQYHNLPTLFFSDAITEVATGGEGLAIVQAGVTSVLARIGA